MGFREKGGFGSGYFNVERVEVITFNEIKNFYRGHHTTLVRTPLPRLFTLSPCEEKICTSLHDARLERCNLFLT